MDPNIKSNKKKQRNPAFFFRNWYQVPRFFVKRRFLSSWL